ncbi:MAG: Soluble pyridine nucleotide transhydrogenase [Chlamydiales bacterium]|nr:Soluble pyridine nucleotide transhydrogenase [Chlamydiales bacterium]
MKHYQIVVIGAGAGGLVVAIGAARAGKKVLLVEKGDWGGDCTNFGCIPSKTLIARAHQPEGVFEYVQKIVSQVRQHEEPEALNKLGVDTLVAEAHFLDSHQLSIEQEIVSADHFVIATGSSPLIPEIEGLAKTPYLTNETVFHLKQVPKSLCVVGGGPIGCELTQAFANLGSKVSLVHRRAYLLKKEESQAQQVITEQFKKEGIELYLDAFPKKIAYDGQLFTLALSAQQIMSEQILIAVGRKPNVERLQLERAHVNYTTSGIQVDRFGRTNQKHIWAIGDVTGGPQFTHAAENQGRAVLTSLLLPFKKKISTQPVPRVTYTDPEVASFGPLEQEAIKYYGADKLHIYNVPLTENDRAITAGRTEGFVKVITKRFSSQILGATIVAPRAGEMLPELSLAAQHKIGLRKIASLIHPYPTYNLAIRRASDLWLTQIFIPRLKKPSTWIAWKRWLPLFIIVLFMVIAYATGVHKYFTFQMLQEKHGEIKAFVSAHPVITPFLYILIYFVSTGLSLPGGALLSLIGGFLFPIPWSTLYVLIGATLGASAIFLAARTAFGEFLREKAGPFLRKMEKGFQKNAWSYLLFLRFVPLFPFWLVNIAPAIFNINFITFVWTTFVGIIPGAYVFTQTGAGLGAIFETGETISLGNIFNVQLRIAMVALGIFSLAPIFIKKWLAKKKNIK